MEGFYLSEDMEKMFGDDELPLEDISMLDEQTKVEKFAKGTEKQFNKSKVKELIDEGKALVRMIYSMKDEDFVEGKVFPQLSRLIVRAVSIYGLFLINPLVGVIGFVTDRYIKRFHDIKQRNRLRKYYESKLEYIEEKIGRAEDEKEKYKLIKLKNTLRTNIKKIDASRTKNLK